MTWGNVRVPAEVIKEIEKKLSSPEFKKMGFNTVSGFVNYLIQRELDRYSKPSNRNNNGQH